METPIGKPITDYTLFDLTDEFILEEVVWLWNDLMSDPNGTQLDKQETLPPVIWATGRYFEAALEKGLLKSETYAEYKQKRDNNERCEQWLSIYLSRKDLVKFALSQNRKPLFLFPEERGKTINKEQEEIERLKGEIQNLQTENKVIKAKIETLFLNKNLPNYSKELEAAVSAWQALFSSGKFVKVGKNTAKLTVGVWLKKNRPGLSEEAIKRIQTMCNPDIFKAGGAPKSGDI